MEEREIIHLNENSIRDLWNGVYFTGSSVEVEGETYTSVEKINTSEYSDGESWEYIVQRQSDKKFFKFSVWDSSREYVFSDGENTLEEVFQKLKTIVEYV